MPSCRRSSASHVQNLLIRAACASRLTPSDLVAGGIDLFSFGCHRLLRLKARDHNNRAKSQRTRPSRRTSHRSKNRNRDSCAKPQRYSTLIELIYVPLRERQVRQAVAPLPSIIRPGLQISGDKSLFPEAPTLADSTETVSGGDCIG